jgi:hypothetical protein
MHLELFLVQGFNPLCSVVWVLSFFSWGFSSFPLREALWKPYTTCRDKSLVLVQFTDFLPSVEEKGFPLFEEGMGTFLRLMWWFELGLCEPWIFSQNIAFHVARHEM